MGNTVVDQGKGASRPLLASSAPWPNTDKEGEPAGQEWSEDHYYIPKTETLEKRLRSSKVDCNIHENKHEKSAVRVY